LCVFAFVPVCLGFSFPIQDWQFWVVTAIAALALAWLTRNVLPIPILSRRAKAKKTQKRVTLTIGGKSPER